MTIKNSKIDQSLSLLGLGIDQWYWLLTDSVFVIWPDDSLVTTPRVAHPCPNLAKVGNNWIDLNPTYKGKSCMVDAARFITIILIVILLVFSLFLLGKIKSFSCSNSGHFRTNVSSGPFNSIAPLNSVVYFGEGLSVHYKLIYQILFLSFNGSLCNSALLVLSGSSIGIISVLLNLNSEGGSFSWWNLLIECNDLLLNKLDELIKNCLKTSNKSLILVI